MAIIEGADGVALHVETDGPADAPVTVVLAHGWTLDGRTWAPVARALVAGPAPVRVVRPDHRGHGRSAAVDPSTMTIEQLADDLAAVIAAAAPDGPLVLAGHSMGGMTLMALAQRHPRLLDRVGGIALVGTACGGIAELTLGLPAIGAAAFRQGEKLLYGSPRWTERRRMGSPTLLGPPLRWLLLGRRPTPEAVRLTVNAVAACRPATVAGFRPTLEAHDREAALAEFARIPTVVMVGAHDRLLPVASSQRISDALPGAELTVVADAGHMLPVERVTEVAAQLTTLAQATAPEARRAAG